MSCSYLDKDFSRPVYKEAIFWFRLLVLMVLSHVDVMHYVVMAASAALKSALKSVACIFADIEDFHHPYLRVL